MSQVTRILNEIHVYVDYAEARDTQFAGMDMRTRFICNYLERKIKPLRFRTPGFSSICVIGQANPQDQCLINSCHVICVDLPFAVDRWQALSDDEMTKLACDMLRSGLKKCASQQPVPLTELLGALDEFERLGHVNHWTHCSRFARSVGRRWTVNCTFTTHEFRLDLVVAEKDGKELCREEVFRTRGDEFAWVPLFVDAKHRDGKIFIVGKGQQPVYEFDLARLKGTPSEFLQNWETL